MANRKLTDRNLTIEYFNDQEIQVLLDWISKATSGSRWVIGCPEGPNGTMQAVWPVDGTTETVSNPELFCRDRGQIGFVFEQDSLRDFFARFKDASDPVKLMRVAGKVAPLMADLHAEIRGIDYNLHPAAKTQRLMNLFGRFLPKNKAIAIQSMVDGVPLGMYMQFNARREVSRIVGLRGWPAGIAEGGKLSELKHLGAPVEIGIRITSEAFASLFEDRLNRSGYAQLFRKGDIVLDPLPLAPKLALKAARII